MVSTLPLHPLPLGEVQTLYRWAFTQLHKGGRERMKKGKLAMVPPHPATSPSRLKVPSELYRRCSCSRIFVATAVHGAALCPKCQPEERE